MKILPWILVIGLTVAAAWFYSEDQQKGAEVVALKTKVQKMKAAGDGESHDTAASAGSEEEMQRLRKENEELYRLRAEVAQLKKEKQNAPKMQHVEVAQGNAEQPFDAPQEPPPQPDDEATRIKNEHAMQCVNNMKIIEDAKTKWAEANSKNGGDTVSVNDITTYLPNQTMPICPDAGTYSLNEIGIPVSCTVEGHSLLP